MSALRQAEVICAGKHELMLLGVRANGAVKGRLLAMSLQQRFRNSSDINTEITYTFPLPWGAVLMGVDVELNGKQLRGEVSAKNTARARYEEALSEGNSSIMLELNPDHSYTLELGNLMAREECGITIRYAQVLQLEHGQIRMMLPTTIAPRYGNALTQGRLQPHAATVTDLTAEYPFDISLTLYGDLAKANVASPSHKTGYFPGNDELVVRLAQRGSLDRDFILIVSDLQSQSAVIACKDSYVDGQDAVMASFSPQFAASIENTVSAKILVDCSGSMGGDSIEAARNALRSIVSGLGKDDKFSLSRFGSTVEHRSRGMWSGTSQTKASAQRWIDGVNADLGGTEMASALVSTIAISHNGKSDILLITDGEIEGIDEVIDVATKSGHRVFVVAIGASPAEVHLRRLASATGGICDFVAPGEDVEPAVIRMFSRLRASRARKLRVEWPADISVKWASKLPNQAFENDALTVCAFIPAPSAQVELATVKLWGCLDDAETETLLSQATVSYVDSTVNTLARMTASTQYLEFAAVKATLKLSEALSKSQDLAVLYQLVTNETNFILVHERSEAEKAQEMPDSHKVPQMLPAGWGATGSISRSVHGTNVLRSGQVVNSPVGVYMSTPSVWRTRDRTCAAAKVDALSTGGMDDFEIPAFLRMQSGGGLFERSSPRRSIDKSNPSYWTGPASKGGLDHGANKLLSNSHYVGITPAGLDEWLNIHSKSDRPKTYAGLQSLGLGLSICEWLEFEIGSGHIESAVVKAFIAVMQGFGFVKLAGLHKTVNVIKSVISPQKTTPFDTELASLILKGLQGIQPNKWPNSVVNFPEVAVA